MIIVLHLDTILLKIAATIPKQEALVGILYIYKNINTDKHISLLTYFSFLNPFKM